ncbi:MAG: DUF177 domain-containing protein [Clostridia bacterium]|nr:DUF177 domain-containing protein [Clostridia bacterium]
MIINLKTLLDGKVNTLAFEETQDMSDFELYGVRPFQSGLLVKGVIEKRTGLITLHLSLSAELNTLCASCGKAISQPFSVEAEYLLARTLYEDNDEILLYADDKLELDEVVSDLTALNMDMRPLCSPDCKGVCFGCGANLNDGPCACTGKASV